MILGAAAGDVIGSVYEGWRGRIKSAEFPLFVHECRFTDDTVLTMATACAILHRIDYGRAYWEFGRRYPNRGYGGSFRQWLASERPEPYGSWGNGSAMRVSPVGWAFDSIEAVLEEAAKSAAATHNHPEGIAGAQAVALAVFLARTGADKAAIRAAVEERFGYDLGRTVEAIRPGYGFDSSCRGSVPEAIICFLESADFESAVRLAVSLGGDADTQACIAGAIAEAFYGGVPEAIARETMMRLGAEFQEIIAAFEERYGTR
jgi:ADP-ribosylglycohydrolase